MDDKRSIKKVSFLDDAEGYSMPEKLLDFINLLQGFVDETPDEFKDKIEVHLGTETNYDCSSPTIDVYYYRPETDEEMTDRLSRERARREEAEAKERRLFEQLKSKYA